MLCFALGFLIGNCILQCQSSLPPSYLLYWCALGSFLLYFVQNPYFSSPKKILLGLLLGFAWAFIFAQGLLKWQLPKNIEGQPVLIEGVIADIPQVNHYQIKFLFNLEALHYQGKVDNPKQLIELTHSNLNFQPKVGDTFQFKARLKRIHSTQNPGSFDFEAWALQKGIRARGIIQQSPDNRFLTHHHFRYFLQQWRQKLLNELRQQLPGNSSPWLLALILGERSGIPKDEWEVLRRTGTNHLMAIAGLHIGMLVGLIHWLITCWWRCFPLLAIYLPRQYAASACALMVAFIYSAMAGFSIPTQRASIMLSVFVMATLSQRKVNPWHSWSLALLIILILHPLSVLNTGFWMSFLTIALIIYGTSGRLNPQGLWWKWGRMQWVITLGLLPLSLYLFQEYSLTAFFANMVAIPWLGFLILPFCFLSAIFLFLNSHLTQLCLWIANKHLIFLWQILKWFADRPLSAWHFLLPNELALLAATIAFLFFLLPRGLPGRWLGIVWLLPILFYQPTKPRSGEFFLQILDVGQGLAVVLQTKTHTLVYDTGLKFNDYIDSGEAIVLPFLRMLKTKKLDMVVISHGDSDHIGGLNALVKALPITTIKTSVPEKIHHPAVDYCQAGLNWQWDKVKFTFLYPNKAQLHSGNDSSCVLQVSNGAHSLLLTGDIERFAERQLLNLGIDLRTEILIAPHHGSKTSGLPQFIYATHPKWVIFPTGYRNRYHFPHVKVVARYHAIQARTLNTAETGAIQFKIGQTIESPILYRTFSQHYWFDNEDFNYKS